MSEMKINGSYPEGFQFSVLMSVYYRENPAYLREAFDSVLVHQELQPDEMVLVVDGQVPGALNEIIESYQARFGEVLRVYRLAVNSGLGKALNYGLEKCSYPLIARADSDDINDPRRFKEQVERFRQDPALAVLGTCVDEFDQDNRWPRYEKKMPFSHVDIVKMAKFRNPIMHMSVMFKKEAVTGAGGYQHLPYLEDYYLWVRALSKGYKFANLDKCLVHVRVGNNMLKRRSSREYLTSWSTLGRFMKTNRMINLIEYWRNMLSIYVFIYMPVPAKKAIYKVFLRNSSTYAQN